MLWTCLFFPLKLDVILSMLNSDYFFSFNLVTSWATDDENKPVFSESSICKYLKSSRSCTPCTQHVIYVRIHAWGSGCCANSSNVTCHVVTVHVGQPLHDVASEVASSGCNYGWDAASLIYCHSLKAGWMADCPTCVIRAPPTSSCWNVCQF